MIHELLHAGVLAIASGTSAVAPEREPWIFVDAPEPQRYDGLGAPQLVVLTDETYVAKYEHTGHYGSALGTYICRSEDRGTTWSRIAKLDRVRSTSLLVVGGRLYLFGIEISRSGYAGKPCVRSSTDGGSTWSLASDEKTGLLRGEAMLSTSNASAVVDGGRVWLPFWRLVVRDGKRTTQALVASATVASDLALASSWRWSDEIVVDRSVYSAFLSRVADSFVLALQGFAGSEVVAIGHTSNEGWNLRGRSDPAVEQTLPEHLASRAPRRVELNDAAGPGSNDVMGVLTRPPSPLSDSDERAIGHTLAWSVSSDGMKSWEDRTTLLNEPNPKGVAFGWSDWTVDGDDLLVVSCAGIRDSAIAGEQAKLRDGLVFLRVPRFRERTPQTPPMWGPPLDATQKTTDPSPK